MSLRFRFFPDNFWVSALLLFYLLPHSVQAQWEEVNMPLGGTIYGIETDGNALFAMMPTGIFRWTPGASWKKCHAQNLQNFAYFKYTQGILYLNDADITTGKPILYSTDQGDSWKEIQNFRFDKWTVQANGQKIFAHNSHRDSFFVSIDFGENWNYLPNATPGTGKILDFSVLGDTMFIVLPNQVARSFDGGFSWDSLAPPQVFPTNVNTNCRLVTASGLWYAKYYQNGSILYRSRDEGVTWESLGPAQPYDNIWRVGNRIFAYFPAYSDDFGLTWTSVAAPGIHHDFLEFQGKLTMSCSVGLFDDAGGFLWHSRNENFPVPLNTSSTDEALLVSSGPNLVASSGFFSPDGGYNWYLPQSAKGMNGNPAVRGDTIVSTTLNEGIWYSTNAGESWELLSLGSIISPFTILFGAEKLYVLASNNKVWSSSDLGQNWEMVPTTGIEKLYALLYDGQDLYAMDRVNKKVYRSPDEGQTWIHLDQGFPTNTVTYKTFANKFGVFVAATDHLYWYNGQEWVISDGGYTFSISTLKMFASNNLLGAVRQPGALGVMLSPDGGRHWFNALLAGIDQYVTTTAAEFHEDRLYAFTTNLDNNIRRLVRRSVSGITGLPVTGRIHGQIEPGVPQVLVRLRSGDGVATPGQNSVYELFGLSGPDTLELAPIPGYSDIQPPFWPLNQGGTDYDFYLGLPDAVCAINITNNTPFKADVETILSISLGCTPDTGYAAHAKIFLPSNVAYVSAQPAPSNTNGSLFEWIDLHQNSNGFPEINLRVRTSAQALLGDSVLFRGSFKNGTVEYADTLLSLVVSSFDPNDKRCNPSVLSPQAANAGALLDYTIRFQNTGNATAQTVRILDTLTQKIDLSTFQFVAASHPSVVQIQPGRTLEFLFQDIMLPDSNSNEAESHGFIRFLARSKSGLQLGDSITNRAAIYFDLNAPVITADCVTRIQTLSNTQESDISKFAPKLLLSPNPGSGPIRLTIQGQTLQEAQISVADVSGKQLKVWQHVNSDFFEIPSGSLPSGIWFVTVRQNGWTANEMLWILP